MLYSKKNYLIIAVSVAIIIIGFVLMSGGGAVSPAQFNADIFSTRRVVLAPIVCLIGFVLMVYGIMYKSSKK